MSTYGTKKYEGTKLSAEQRNTILAALRLWIDELNGEAPDQAMLDDIATDGGSHPPMTAEGVDALCESLNMGELAELVEDDDDELDEAEEAARDEAHPRKETQPS